MYMCVRGNTLASVMMIFLLDISNCSDCCIICFSFY